MSVKEFVTKLNIDDSNGRYTEKEFATALKDSNEFARMYSTFDNLKNSEPEVHMTENHSICNFYLDEFDVTIEADLAGDNYTLTITEVK